MFTHSLMLGFSLFAVADAATSENFPVLRAGSRLETTTQGRDTLKYIVRCALPQGMSVNVSREGEPQLVAGAFGLAPDWSHAPLPDAGRRWISACVLGFVNALGEHVLVSMRGDNANLRATVSDEERARFDFQEAAFYGDIFSKTPVAYVCRGKGGSKPSAARVKRLCSDPSERAGVSRCDMIITGDCADVCASEDPIDHAYRGCRGGDRIYDEAVTVFLPTTP